MGFIKLHPKDCEKYGAPEVIPFSLTSIGTRQRAAFENSPTGPRKPLRWLIDQIGGVPELDEAGNAIPVPVIDDETGEQKIGDDGQPMVTEKLTRDPETFAMIVWLGLWGVGIRVPWDTFDVREIGLHISIVDDEDDAQGKAEPPAADSESSTTD